MIKTYLFLGARGVRDPFRFHGEAAAEAIARACPRAVGYGQCRMLAEQLDAAAEPPYAGVAELWFADPADALALAPHRDELAAGLFRAPVTVAAAVTGEERILMRLPAHHSERFIKGVFPFRRRASLSVEAFQRYWLHQHGPLAAVTEQALAYVQCHPLPRCYESGDPPAFDGVTELHWRDVAAARRAMGSRQMREVQALDAENFAEPGSVQVFLVEEALVMPP